MTNNVDNSLHIVSLFLSRFYHEQPDDILASTNAVTKMSGLFDYEWEIASAFRDILQQSLPPGTLQKLVREWGNRAARSDDEARVFLEKIYDYTGLEGAIDISDDDSDNTA